MNSFAYICQEAVAHQTIIEAIMNLAPAATNTDRFV